MSDAFTAKAQYCVIARVAGVYFIDDVAARARLTSVREGWLTGETHMGEPRDATCKPEGRKTLYFQLPSFFSHRTSISLVSCQVYASPCSIANPTLKQKIRMTERNPSTNKLIPKS